MNEGKETIGSTASSSGEVRSNGESSCKADIRQICHREAEQRQQAGISGKDAAALETTHEWQRAYRAVLEIGGDAQLARAIAHGITAALI